MNAKCISLNVGLHNWVWEKIHQWYSVLNTVNKSCSGTQAMQWTKHFTMFLSVLLSIFIIDRDLRTRISGVHYDFKGLKSWARERIHFRKLEPRSQTLSEIIVRPASYSLYDVIVVLKFMRQYRPKSWDTGTSKKKTKTKKQLLWPYFGICLGYI